MIADPYSALTSDGAIVPSLESFVDLAAGRRVIPVCRRLVCDDLTPVALYRALAQDLREPSYRVRRTGGIWTRYSFVG